MIALIFLVICAILFSVFATQNTGVVSISLLVYQFTNVPLYFVILVPFGMGFLFAALFYIFKSISSGFTIRKRENEVEKAKRENTELTKRIHELELENTRLKTKANEESVDEESI